MKMLKTYVFLTNVGSIYEVPNRVSIVAYICISDFDGTLRIHIKIDLS